MRSTTLKSILKTAMLAVAGLVLTASASNAQQVINLTAGPATATLPDGTAVPMWGYTCGAVATGGSTATCAALNKTTTAGVWSPVIITVPTGQGLTINLTNSLSFLPTGATTANTVPTSIMIVGQLGGGLGAAPTTAPSPAHASQVVTWAVVGSSTAFTPPGQLDRVQSFGTEVAPGATRALTWAAATLRPGTYLLESGTHPSIQGPMGLIGMLVVTAAPVGTAAGTAYPVSATNPTAVTYNADVPLLMSEIDPVQNAAVNAAVLNANFSEYRVWSGQPTGPDGNPGCGNPNSAAFYQSCYPPAVNYTPLYYMFNGVAFNKTLATASSFAVTPATGLTPLTGQVLVRFVNAGSRMHVPSIVGSQTLGQTGTLPRPTVTGFALIAEDGNPLPGVHRVQSDVFMAAGKTYDVMINAPAAGTTALPVYDRELSLSGNATERDAGMLAYISVNGAAEPASGAFAAAVARADTYNSLVAGQTLTVSDPSKGVVANDTNVYGVQLNAAALPANGTVTLNANGTFTYVPSGTAITDSFGYCANGTTAASLAPICTTVTLGSAALEATSGINIGNKTFTSNLGTSISIKPGGVLTTPWDSTSPCTTSLCRDFDAAGYPLSVVTPVTPGIGSPTINMDSNGGFTASVSSPGTYTFTYQVQNSQGTISASTATVTLIFPTPSNLTVNVLDGYDKTTQITDYRWIIEEDKTFYINPACTTNPQPTGCPVINGGIVPTLGVNFHTSNMPYVAQGCTGPLSCEGGQTVLGVPAVCDVGNGACRFDATGNGFTPVLPSQVALDPTKRYYISVLPGDSANPFAAGYAGTPDCTTAGHCGHGMGGAPVPALPANSTVYTAPVTILSQPSPYPPGKLSVFVFEDDFPLNGEKDTGGGTGAVNSNNEPGLGQFQLHLWDAMGGNGDFTGQMGFDMFNQPLTNSLAGTKDPTNGFDACPISLHPTSATTGANPSTLSTDPTATGITGFIVTCPEYEDGKDALGNPVPSPLAGQAVVANLMPGRWGVVATPGADRIAKGEEWLQTNTLDGQKAHDVFTRVGEPSYFQEFGPASFHVSIGFANPAIINGRHDGVCNNKDVNITVSNCNNSIQGHVVGERLSRTPDERLYSSGSHDAFYWTQCFASFGDPDGEDFVFTKCDAKGNFTLTGLPDGDWRVTTFDQWNDQLVDGLSTPVRLAGGKVVPLEIAGTQWQTNLYTKTFIDDAKTGVSPGPNSAGIPFANVAVRLRDGSLENLLVTDFTGVANFNESFPLFSWYTVETDVTRYKNTGTHVVYDAGGPADGSPSCGVAGYPPCGSSLIGQNLANTVEQVSVPANLRIPGAVYCPGADCTGYSIQNGPSTSAAPTSGTTYLSTGRIDPPWVGIEGWQGFPGQNSFLEFGKEPYVAGENGGIKGHVIYASTRPFDDPQMLVQTQWEPLVPHVTINLYQEGFASDGITPTLTLVDTTQTSSFDDFAQGFRADGVTPNMSCPGQGASTGPVADLFFFSLFNQPNYLNYYNSVHSGPAFTALPYNSQFKCFDGMHNWNQIQPAPYDGAYKFPSVTATDAATGKPTATNCTICTANYVSATTLPTTDLYYGLPQLPAGKYVVEAVLPPGYELVKEEDKNILIGDNYIAPVTQQFGGLGNIFILPDQAQVASAYNANNAQNPTNGLGTTPSNNIVPAFIPEPTWPCVGQSRIVPDYISLYPQTLQVAPFAGATRNLCDRKEVTLGDQMGAIAKFYIYTSTHIASKFTGGITDDYTSEFDPFSPQFGEKFSPPNLPVSIKDWAGNETNRVYADHWGSYDGMTYSTWEVNPPNPTGYAPTMMVVCMNDPGPIPGAGGTMITDPLFDPQYSQFCYELPFMPGTTQYLDTPVVPTSAFAGAGYNNVDCAYPTLTPAIKEVDGDQIGPWVSLPGKPITITSLGTSVSVPNYAYVGPGSNGNAKASQFPYNAKTIVRNYGFGTTKGKVTIGGIDATAGITTWSDTQIVVNVPSGVPQCAIQQQTQYGAPSVPALCGELVVTRGDSPFRQTVDAVTVTIGGKAPTHVSASASIQTAIDVASPGDLLIIDPTCVTTATGAAAACSASAINGTTATQTVSQASHSELLLMWKPVRLQGVGAASSIINANTHPAGKLDSWRQRVNCLFGLSINGSPTSTGNPFDSTGTGITCGGGGTSGPAWTYFKSFSSNGNINPQVDRLPLEAVVGWDAELNGNLAEQLQEPSLMGALEGAGITVLAKGANFPSDPYVTSLLAGFPTGTTLLTASSCTTSSSNPTNPFPSNFWCNPSSIDGLSITNSSQGGGGIFVHGWGHNLQIANNRINSNAGTLSGGINIGQGEYPPAYLLGSTINAAPGSCYTPALFPANSVTTNSVLPYCQNVNVNVHNNDISLNSSTGDELFSATPAGAGGVSFCTGSDNYKFNYNWLCGNLSTGDGGGLGHLGFSFNGDIEHNSVLFNQSLNPTIPTNGGGMIIMGTPDADIVCNNQPTVDADCPPPPTPGGIVAAGIGPSDGVGPNLTINANLIMGNAAEAGDGGGIAFQAVNGSDVVAFPNGSTQLQYWNSVNVTNNIIADNVAGWDGAGISLVDSVNVNIINNTIASNASTATSGMLFTTLGAPIASQVGGTNCTNGTATASCPEVGGLVSIQNSAIFSANIAPLTVTCPTNHYQPGTPASQGTCKKFSYPYLANDVFWQNSSYYVGVSPTTSPAFQQSIVTMYNAFTTTPVPSQTATGQCTAASYWDLGVRGDKGPGDHSSTVTLAPTYSILTSTSGYPATNFSSNPAFVSQYCDGARTPPEYLASGFAVPPGIADATVPNPIFNFTPVATVDEGNNWINLRWGPLSLLNPVTSSATTNVVLGNYSLAASSPAINAIPTSAPTFAVTPSTDFFGNARPDAANPTHFDVGAVEVAPPAVAVANVTPTPTLAFGNVVVGTTPTLDLTVHNTGNALLTGITVTGLPTPGFSRPAGAAGGTCGTTLAGPGTCTITVQFAPTATTTYGGTVTITASVAVAGSPVTLSGTGVARRVGVTFTPAAHSFGTVTRNCPGSLCGTDPIQAFTLTNTGNVQVTNITAGALAGTNATEYFIYRPGTTCGTAFGNAMNQPSLAPGGSCMITVQFRPATAQTIGLKSATISVTDNLGSGLVTQTSTLTGTAQ